MARARNIKPGFFESEDPARVGFPQRLLWISLWTLADRAGRLERRPQLFKKYAFGYDDIPLAEVSVWIDQLVEAGLLLAYSVDGKDYLEVSNFTKHQNPHLKEPQSVIPQRPIHSTKPAPDEHHTSTILAPCQHHASTVLAPDEHHTSTILARLIPDSGLLIADSGEPEPGPSALARLPRPPHQALPLDQDPQSDLAALAEELVQQLPAGGDVHLTRKALERDFGHSATFAGDSARYVASVREKARLWNDAWNANASLRVKPAQYWIQDGDYARKPPPPRTSSNGMTRLVDLFPEVPNASE